MAAGSGASTPVEAPLRDPAGQRADEPLRDQADGESDRRADREALRRVTVVAGEGLPTCGRPHDVKRRGQAGPSLQGEGALADEDLETVDDLGSGQESGRAERRRATIRLVGEITHDHVSV